MRLLAVGGASTGEAAPCGCCKRWRLFLCAGAGFLAQRVKSACAAPRPRRPWPGVPGRPGGQLGVSRCAVADSAASRGRVGGAGPEAQADLA
eukprot:7387314-Prymnesium_polylepis.1